MKEAEECSSQRDGSSPISSISFYWQNILLILTFSVLFKQKETVFLLSVWPFVQSMHTARVLSPVYYRSDLNVLLIDQLCFCIINLLKPGEGILISTQNTPQKRRVAEMWAHWSMSYLRNEMNGRWKVFTGELTVDRETWLLLIQAINYSWQNKNKRNSTALK